MSARARRLLLVVALTGGVIAPEAQARPGSSAGVGNVTVFAALGAPGHPFGVLPTHDGVFVTTSSGTPFHPGAGVDAVLEYPASGGSPIASASVTTMRDMGLFGAAEDANGRLYVVDMNGRVLRFHPGRRVLSAPETYAAVPPPYGTLGWKSSMWMLPAFDDEGNLYVTDEQLGAVWRIPPNGDAELWFRDPRLACVYPGGLNGIALAPDGKSLLLALPGQGQIWRLRISTSPTSSDLTLFHQFAIEDGSPTPFSGSTDLVFGRSHRLYVTLPTAGLIAVLSEDGATEVDHISSDRFAFPLGLRFLDDSLLVANSHYLDDTAGEVLRVEVGESGLPLARPTIPS